MFVQRPLTLGLFWVFVAMVVGFIIYLTGYYFGRNVALKRVLEARLSSAPRYDKSLLPDSSNNVEFERLKPGYYVLVNMDKDLNTIVKLKETLSQNGFASAVEAFSVAGVTFYRLYVGPEPTRELAEKLLIELQRENYLPYDLSITFVRDIF